ncbi:MAG: hypothetical protein U1F43_26775 [Myxococcota bacterium]
MRARWLCGLALTLAPACGTPAPTARDKVAEARQALAEGSPKRALPLVADEAAGPGLVLRVRAQIGTQEWGSVPSLVAKVPAGADKDGLACLLAAARTDVDAVQRCESAARATFEDPVLGDEVRTALAAAYETEHRPDAAEQALRALVSARPTRPNRKALVDFFDRQGFVKDGVESLEAWVASDPEDPTIKARLGQMLERKVRGDLLDKRYAEAEAAARRLLVVVPSRGEIRYYLADALAKQGKADEAAAERKKAVDAHIKEPPPVDSFPGMQPPPDALTKPATGAPGSVATPP